MMIMVLTDGIGQAADHQLLDHIACGGSRVSGLESGDRAVLEVTKGEGKVCFLLPSGRTQSVCDVTNITPG